MSKVKTQTLAEFKAWLQGIIEIQPKGWTPDGAQWKMIKQRIDCIVDEPATSSHSTIQAQINPYQQAQPSFITQSGPPIPSSLVPEMTQKHRERKRVSNGPPIQTADGRMKAPDIDTSDGTYTSPFAE